MKDTFVPYTIIETIRQLDNIYQLRLFGWVLAKSQAVLKLYNRDLSDINLQHAIGSLRVTFPLRYLLNGETDKNYTNAYMRVRDMALKCIDFELKDSIFRLNIIANPYMEKRGRLSFISFIIDEKFWWALSDFSKGYRLIHLPTFLKLNTTRACCMYILCSQQTKDITYDIEKLKRLMGATSPAYRKNSNFINKYLIPAQQELDAVAPYSFSFQTVTEGRQITKVVISPRAVTMGEFTDGDTFDEELLDTLDRQRVRLDPMVAQYIADSFHMDTAAIERIERLVLTLGRTPAEQLVQLGGIKTTALRNGVRNLGGYLTTALRNR